MMTAFSLRHILLALLYVKCLIGFTVNVIIVAANVMKWRSQKSFPTCDKILSHLAISRGLYFIMIMIRVSIIYFHFLLKKYKFVPLTLNTLNMFLLFLSQWIATVLCIFYCVKIVTYNCAPCVFLRSRISTMVPWLVTASLIMSLISSLSLAWYGYHYRPHKVFIMSLGNNTVYGPDTDETLKDQFLIFAAGSFPSFIIFCFSTLLLMYFLFVHTQRMKSNGSQIHNPNLKSHYGVLKSMSLFLLLQILFFIGTNLFASGNFLHFQYPMLIGWMILCSPPLLHSLYLISSLGAVRKVFISMCPGVLRC